MPQEILSVASSRALRPFVLGAALFVALVLIQTDVAAATVSLAWDQTNSTSVAGYMLYYGPAAGNYPNKIDVGNVLTYTVPNLTEGSTYHFAVTDYDASKSESAFSNDVSTTIPYGVPVANFTASATSGPAPLALNFGSTSTGTITSYLWTFGDNTTSAAQSPAKVYSTPGVYTVSLKVTGPGGTNTKTLSNYITVTTGTDTTPPTVPSSLTATASGSSTINLAWTASTDNVGVANYRIERCQGASCGGFVQIASVAGATYSDSGLAAATTYRYRIRAADAAGNLSAYSSAIAATTAATADTTPPTVPSSLSATASGSSTINLAWAASTDNVGVANYRIERCQGASCGSFVQIASVAGTTYSDSGLAAATTYRYRIRAADAAGNLSAYSSAVAATTATGAAIGFVQLSYATPQTLQQTVAVTFWKTQTAGNLNVVVVGWNDTTASVQSVTDTSGNVYTRAVGPTSSPGQLTQSIYYAKNIAAAGASNTVTVRFSTAAVYADVRIVEYTGIDKVNPIDVVAAKTGTDSNSTSGAVTTTYANDLLFAANTVTTVTASAGAGYTARVIAQPDGDIVQDRVVAATGSQTASAPLSPAGSWIMQLIAFRGN